MYHVFKSPFLRNAVAPGKNLRSVCKPSFETSSQELRNIKSISSFLFTNRHCHKLIKRNAEIGNKQGLLRCHFSTTGRRRIPPFIVVFLRPLSKFGAALIGRAIRHWRQSLSDDKKKIIWRRIADHKGKIAVGFGTVGISIVAYYGSHLEETPITKRKRLILLTRDACEVMAAQELKKQLQQYRENIVPESHPSYKLVGAVVDRLLLGNKDIQQLNDVKKWSIIIVDNPAINAHVLFTGELFVYTGMLDFCENIDQLGCVLGHEISHVALNHMVESRSYTHVVDIVLMITLTALWALLPSDATSLFAHWLTTKISNYLLELPYSRKLEMEADVAGLHIAAKACFDIREIPIFWQRMMTIDGDKNIEWLSTHPHHENRAKMLNELMPAAIELRNKSNCVPFPKPNPDFIAFNQWVQTVTNNLIGYKPGK